MLPQHDGIIDSTLRAHHASPVSSHSAGPDEFMDELLNEVEKGINLRILTPLPVDMRPELFKKSQGQGLTVKWLGQNDIKTLSKLDTFLASMDVFKWVEG